MPDYLIVRLSSLGDIIHTLPAFAELRKKRPDSRISWVVDPPGKTILDLVSGIDRIIVRGERGWLRALRNRDRIAIDFQGLLKSAVISRLSGARERIGFSGKNLREPAAACFYTSQLAEITEDRHVIRKNLDLLEAAGLKIESGKWDFPIALPEALRQSVRASLGALGLQAGQDLVLCNVGAAWESKRWAPERWIELLPLIGNERRFFLLLWGNEEERRMALKIQAATGAPLAPFFSIPEVMALLAESRCLISGDTFALQAACALDVPVVGIFGPTNPLRNGPFRESDRTAFFPMDCRPCYRRTCPSSRCLNGVTATEIARLFLEIMRNHA